jgi:putative heme degradation protein
LEEAVALTEEMLRACRTLGPARVVLRNPVGVVDVFADLDRLELRDGWAHLCAEPFHVHLHCHAIAQVSFREPADGQEGHGRALWFGDRRGVPLLLLILDRARGEVAVEQARVFDELRARHGATRAMVSVDALPARPALH